IGRLVVCAFVLATLASPPAQAAGSSDPSGFADCGDSLVPDPSGGWWACSFGDEFTGSEVDPTKWVTTTSEASAFTNAGECYTSNPENVSVDDDVLTLTARKQAQALPCPGLASSTPTSYTGGAVTSWSRFSQTYGRFE